MGFFDFLGLGDSVKSAIPTPNFLNPTPQATIGNPTATKSTNPSGAGNIAPINNLPLLNSVLKPVTTTKVGTKTFSNPNGAGNVAPMDILPQIVPPTTKQPTKETNAIGAGNVAPMPYNSYLNFDLSKANEVQTPENPNLGNPDYEFNNKLQQDYNKQIFGVEDPYKVTNMNGISTRLIPTPQEGSNRDRMISNAFNRRQITPEQSKGWQGNTKSFISGLGGGSIFGTTADMNYIPETATQEFLKMGGNVGGMVVDFALLNMAGLGADTIDLSSTLAKAGGKIIPESIAGPETLAKVGEQISHAINNGNLFGIQGSLKAIGGGADLKSLPKTYLNNFKQGAILSFAGGGSEELSKLVTDSKLGQKAFAGLGLMPGFGYISTKIQGGSDKEAMQNALLFGVMETLGLMKGTKEEVPFDEQLKQQGFTDEQIGFMKNYMTNKVYDTRYQMKEEGQSSVELNGSKKSIENEAKTRFGEGRYDVQYLPGPTETTYHAVVTPRNEVKYQTKEETPTKVTGKFVTDLDKEVKSDTVKKGTIENMLNRQGYKEPEKRIIKEVLGSMNGDVINKQDFIKQVQQKFLDLGTKKTSKRADYNSLRDQEGYNVDNTYSRIYESPFMTEKGGSHFGDETDKYFSHARVEDIGDKNRIVEIQSDLFQRQRYKNEGVMGSFEGDLQRVTSLVGDYDKQIKLIDKIEGLVKNGKNREDIKSTFEKEGIDFPHAWIDSRLDTKRAKERLESNKQKYTSELSALKYMKENNIDMAGKKLVEKYFSVKEAYDYQSQKLEKLERLQKDPLWNDTINQDKQEIMRDNYKLSGFEGESIRGIKSNDEYLSMLIGQTKNSKNSSEGMMKYYMDKITEAQKITPQEKKQHLEDYSNRRYERTVREEIRNASLEGKKYIQLPDPKTIAKIEGYLTQGGAIAEGMNIGDVVETPEGSDGVIIGDNGDSYEVVPESSIQNSFPIEDWIKDSFDRYIEDLKDSSDNLQDHEAIDFLHEEKGMYELWNKEHPEYEGNIPTERDVNNPQQQEDLAKFVIDHSDDYESFFEEKRYGGEYHTNSTITQELEDMGYWPVIDNGKIYLISRQDYDSLMESVAKGNNSDNENRYENLSEDQKAVVDFYKNKLLPYAEKLKKGSEYVEEDGGRWLQIPIEESDKGPVSAFQLKSTKQGESAIAEEQAKIVQKYLPEVSTEIQDRIMAPDGLEAYGKYLNGMITFAKDPLKTTGFHEIFHAYFDLFTTPERQRELLDMVKEDQGFKDDIKAEERLADNFADHALALEGKAKEGDIFYKIKDFFDELWRNIQKVFGQGNKVKDLYRDIIDMKRPDGYLDIKMKGIPKYELSQADQELKDSSQKYLNELETIPDLGEHYNEEGLKYLNSMESKMQEIENIIKEGMDIDHLSPDDIADFANSKAYDKLDPYEQMNFDRVANKILYPSAKDLMKLSDPLHQFYTDRAYRIEETEKHVGFVGGKRVNKTATKNQANNVTDTRENMILSLRQDYKLDANEAVDKYNYFVERPLKEVSERYKNPPVKRSWRKTDQMVKENEKAISRIEKDEEARKKASIYGGAMTQARERGQDKAELKNYVKMTGGTGEPKKMDPNDNGDPFPTKPLGDKRYETNRPTKEDHKKLLNKPNKDVSGHAIDRFHRNFQFIGDQLKNMSKAIYGRVKQYDFNMLNEVKKDLEESTPFLRGLDKIESTNKNDYFDLRFALSNRDPIKTNEILDKYKIEAPVELLNRIWQEGTDQGYTLGYLEDFFPREIRDHEGLVQFIMKDPEFSPIKELIQGYIQRNLELGEDTSIEQQASAINLLLQGKDVEGLRLANGHMAERLVDKVTKDLLQYYHKPQEALMRYVYKMRESVERSKMFGMTATNDSMGAYVIKEAMAGTIKWTDIPKIKEILDAKFSQRNDPFISRVKALGYSSTLGSFASTLTVVGDYSFSIIENGLFKTIKGLGEALSGKGISIRDIGLQDIGEEFRSEGMAKVVQKYILKGTGFSWMEKTGKNTYMNSTFDKIVKQAKAENESLQNDLYDYFGEKLGGKIISDLKAGKDTDDVRLYLFMKLCNIQPLTNTESTISYLNNPSARIFYMLKTFALNQVHYIWNEGLRKVIDSVKTFDKNDVLGSIKKSTQATAKLMKIATVIMLMNGISDELKNITLGRYYNSITYRMMNGQDIQPALTDLYIDNFLKLLGLSKYNVYNIKMNGLDATFQNILLSIPPLQIPGNLLADGLTLITGKKDTKGNQRPLTFQDFKSIQMVPRIGKPLYRWTGGGQASQQTSLHNEVTRAKTAEKKASPKSLRSKLQSKITTTPSKSLRSKLIKQ